MMLDGFPTQIQAKGMTKRISPQAKIIKAAHLAESKGEDNLAFYLTAVSRSISAATQTEVKLESWDEFSSWWNANRSPGLLFSLMDALGKGHPAIKKLQEINKKSDFLDKELHGVYMMLKGKATKGGEKRGLTNDEACGEEGDDCDQVPVGDEIDTDEVGDIDPDDEQDAIPAGDEDDETEGAGDEEVPDIKPAGPPPDDS